MKLHEMVAVTLACASPWLLAACGGGDSEGVTGAGSGPVYPSVSGTWQGQWTRLGGGPATEATLELSQSRNQVQGTLTVGRVVNDVDGTVSEFGVLHFRGQQPNGCTTYSTESPHLVLEERNTTLDGPVVRSEPNLGGPCGSGPSFLTEGRMDFRKTR